MQKIYFIFYISLLELALKNTKLAKNIEIKKETKQEYKVEKILEYKRVNRKLYYLIK